MNRFLRRRLKLPRTETATVTAEQPNDTLAAVGAADLHRRRLVRVLLASLPAAGVALVAGGPEAAQAAPGDPWKLGGNVTGVADGSAFLGTTDNTPLVLKTNNTERMRIRQDGLVGIGTSPGSAQLTIGSSTTNAIRAETTASGGIGVFGIADFPQTTAGVRGAHLGGGMGVVGTSDTSLGKSGVPTGVYGETSGGFGVRGVSKGSGTGVAGSTDSGYGVSGLAKVGDGVHGLGEVGVSGVSRVLNGIGVLGRGDVEDEMSYGIYGISDPQGYAGYFGGRVHVNGTLSKSGGSFKIDHPLDPANKYLYHSFVESPDMMNVYNGNVTTDARGGATVELPAYFEALNSEFRYQLTVIGQFAQAIVASEIVGNQFTIKTDKQHVKVSWQVTGVRQDAYAQAHRIPVEEDKPAGERGTYLAPLEHGQPPEKGREFHRLARLQEPAVEHL
jgi:hypothetical protein